LLKVFPSIAVLEVVVVAYLEEVVEEHLSFQEEASFLEVEVRA